MSSAQTILSSQVLSDGSQFMVGRLANELVWDDDLFQRVWSMHPVERHRIKMFGKETEVARWQQAYGADYRYSGSRNNALQIPAELRRLLEWSREAINSQLNGLLLNWYDGAADYIGPHHDSTTGLIPDTPIVTMSFGETRTFRVSAGRGTSRVWHDFPTLDGTVFVMPWRTNLAWKHEVLKRASFTSRRISVTVRAFSEGVLPESDDR